MLACGEFIGIVLVLVVLLVRLVRSIVARGLVKMVSVLLMIRFGSSYGGSDGSSSRGLWLRDGLGSSILEGLSLLRGETVLRSVGGGLENLKAVAGVGMDVGVVLLLRW
jgi:hypothetical protein